MLTSGAGTRPAPLESSMSGGAQELYNELPVSISPELPAEREPSVSPRANPEASSSPVGPGSKLPAKQHKTHVVKNGAQKPETLDRGDKAGGPQLAESTAGDPVASGDLDSKDSETWSVEKPYLWNGGEREEGPGIAEVRKEGPSGDHLKQHSVDAEEKCCSNQEEPLTQRRTGSLSSTFCSEGPLKRKEDNQGSEQVTTETPLKPTEEVQGTKVNGTGTINNSGCRSNKVSRECPAEPSECPDVDKTMATGEVSETSTLVSPEPLTFAEAGLTEAPSEEEEEREAETTHPPCLLPVGDRSVPAMESEKDLSKSILLSEALDNHQQDPFLQTEGSHSAPAAKTSSATVLSLKGSCSVACLASGEEQLPHPTCEDGNLLSAVAEQRGGSNLGHSGNGETTDTSEVISPRNLPARQERQEGAHLKNSCIPVAESTDKISEEDDKIVLEKQDNLKKQECQRKICTSGTHQVKDLKEGNFSASHQKRLDNGSKLKEASSSELPFRKEPPASIGADEPLISLIKVVENNRATSQLEAYKNTDLDGSPKSNETGIPEIDRLNLTNEMSELSSCPVESVSSGMKNTDASTREKSPQNSVHPKSPEDSLLRNREEWSVESKLKEVYNEGSMDFSQNSYSALEDSKEVITHQQATLIKASSLKDHCSPVVKTCSVLSSGPRDDNVIPVNNSSVKGLASIETIIDSESEDPTLNNRETFNHFQEISVKECEASPSEDNFGYFGGVQNVPDRTCVFRATGSISETGRILSEAENSSKWTPKHATASSEHFCERTEDSSDINTPETRNHTKNTTEQSNQCTLGKDELERIKVENDVQEDPTRDAMGVCLVGSQAVNKAKFSASPAHFLEGAKGENPENRQTINGKKTCEFNLPKGDISENGESSGIPSPKMLLDPSLQLEFLGFNNVKQADGSIIQVANCGLDDRSDLLNHSAAYRNENEASSSGKQSDPSACEIKPKSSDVKRKRDAVCFEEPTEGISLMQQELQVARDFNSMQLPRDLSNADIQGNLKTELTCENSTFGKVNIHHLDCIRDNSEEETSEVKLPDSIGSRAEQDESAGAQLDETSRLNWPQRNEFSIVVESMVERDSDLTATVSSKTESLEVIQSWEVTGSCERRTKDSDNESMSKSAKKVCDSVKEVKAEMHRDAHVSKVESFPNHEPRRKNLGTVNILLNSPHHGEMLRGTPSEEMPGTPDTPGLHIHSGCDKEDSVTISSKESTFSGCQTERTVSDKNSQLVENEAREIPSQFSSSGKNSETSLNRIWIDKVGQTGCSVQAGDRTLPENSEVNEKLPEEMLKSSTAALCVGNGIPSKSDNLEITGIHLPSELNLRSKANRKEIEGTQLGTANHSSVGEVARERITRKDECDKCKQTKIGKDIAQIASTGESQVAGRESTIPEKSKELQQQTVFSAEPFNQVSRDISSADKEPEHLLGQDFCSGSHRKHINNTLKDIHRAKIFKDDAATWSLRIRNSEMASLDRRLANCVDFPADPGLPASQMIPQSDNSARGDENQGAFGTTPVPVKKQPGRKCKKVTSQEPIKTVRKRKIRSSGFLRSSSETILKREHELFSCSLGASKPPEINADTAISSVDHMPKQRTTSCSLWARRRHRDSTKEPALLKKLSVLASKLLNPAKNTYKPTPSQRSSGTLPVAERHNQLRLKNLLDVFSCISMRLNSHRADDRCSKMPDFQPLALYPPEAIQICFLDLNDKPPPLLFDTPIVPISFHIKLESDPAAEISRTASEHCAPPRPALGEAPANSPQPPKWTFSFLLSRSSSGAATVREEIGFSGDLQPPATREPPLPAQVCRRNTGATNRASCSVLGLHTFLALSSPGCYRIWTRRRRNFSSHTLSIQRFFLRGLKGLRSAASVSNDLVSSLPYSLGRVLSIWSQHGPPTCPLNITTLHSSHSEWQPSLQPSQTAENSFVVLPHVPSPGVDAPSTEGKNMRLEPPFSAVVPKSCLAPEPTLITHRLSASNFQVPPFDELDVSTTECPGPQNGTEQKEMEPKKKPKKVSQIRIRKTVPKPDPNLTPMGLPRRKRLKKKEFSLEEIYTNKNYKSPPATRCLETIFEEPKERNGALISVSQQKRKRILEFQDFTIPRKRRARGKVKVMGSFTRAKKAALQGRELDALLLQKLMDLEAFLAEEEGREQGASC
ncbi:protein PRR14L [Tachyglossus aculeatus]|uniref:protein PRR14L n=1 Tax=Tachyglossus aculeatus TaxID=9261 RepID=UPI0018F27979|nr:protein PRR14L [Tachyglossus aculeatus]